MKHYLNFTLKGSHFLPVWIAFFFLFLLPFHRMLGEFDELIASDVPAEGPSKLFFLYLAVVSVMAFIFIFFIAKLVLQNIDFKGIKINCDFNAWVYLRMIITGLALSFITIGIYIPWFVRNINRFFVQGTSYNSTTFSFKAEGGKLFWIITLTILISFLLVGIVLFSILNQKIDIQSPEYIWIYQVIVIATLVSILYLTFHWMVDIQYKNYRIRLDTEFFHAVARIAIELVMAIILVFLFQWLTSVSVMLLWDADSFPAAGKITVEIVLAVTTINIYFAMAFIRIYRYFAEHTNSNIIDGQVFTMGYDGDQLSDFKFMWKQILLTAITFGVYYPWAFSRIVGRMLTQTYIITNQITPTRSTN